jgi:hypothetical protein
MAETPNYGFNPKPEFSVNHISEYLATDNAPQRTKIIRAAKFPKKVEISAYSQIRRPLQSALLKPAFDPDGMQALADRLSIKARRETGYPRDEALRCEKAVRAFITTISPRSFARMQIGPPVAALSFRRAGVRLKVSLDASISAEVDGAQFSGGIVLIYSFSANRGEIRPRLNAVTSLILWALEAGQMEPLPRLCMAADIAGSDVVKASSAHTRFRERVTESCHEISARWNGIKPPEDYDGPDWET